MRLANAKQRSHESAAIDSRRRRFRRAPTRREGDSDENFFIAKHHDSESALSDFCGDDQAQLCRWSVDRRIRRLQKPLWHSRFLDFRQRIVVPCEVFSASLREETRASPVKAPCALSRPLVNTSLSGTLFFSMCWCIRDAVHLDSRVHAAIKPSHYIRRATWRRKLRRQRRRRAQ
jgi:hypothetical protein